MNTKLDFKIETALDRYEVIGSGDMIYTACQIGEWWVIPAQDYQGKIPPDVQKNLFDFLSQGVKIKGFLIAEDMRVIEAKKEREAKKKETDRKAVEAGIGTVMAILGGLAMGIIYLIASAMAYDPMLIAVLDDGRWICLGIWYE